MNSTVLKILKIAGMTMTVAASALTVFVNDKQQSENTKKAVAEYLSRVTIIKKD